MWIEVKALQYLSPNWPTHLSCYLQCSNNSTQIITYYSLSSNYSLSMSHIYLSMGIKSTMLQWHCMWSVYFNITPCCSVPLWCPCMWMSAYLASKSIWPLMSDIPLSVPPSKVALKHTIQLAVYIQSRRPLHLVTVCASDSAGYWCCALHVCIIIILSSHSALSLSAQMYFMNGHNEYNTISVHLWWSPAGCTTVSTFDSWPAGVLRCWTNCHELASWWNQR